MQPTPTRPPAPGWLTQLGSALTAVALIAAVLTPIALSAGPADAHTQQVQRCSYDPFAGQQCWYEDVDHVHPPNHYSPPPDTSPRPEPEPEPEPEEEQQESGSEPDAGDSSSEDEEAGGADPQVPNHYSPPPDTSPRPTPPPTTAPPLPNHYSPPPDTSPRPDPDPEPDAGDTEEEPADDGCLSGTFVSGDCTPRSEDPQSESDAGSGTTEPEAAEPEADDDAANDGQECPKLLGTHPHLDREQHRHLLLWGTMSDCHDATPGHQHTDGTQDTSGGGERYEGLNDILIQIGGLIRTGTEASLNAARVALNRIATDLGEHGLRNAEANVHLGQEIEKLWNRLPEPAQNLIAALSCAGLVAIAAKSIVASGGATLPAWVKWAGGVTGVGVAAECSRRIMALIPDVPSDGGNEQEGDGDDQQSDGDSGATNSETGPPTTTEPPVAVGPVTGLGGSADGNSVWLGWNAPASGPTPTAYRVLRTASGGTEQEVARVRGNAYRDRNLQSGVTYTYRVQAIRGTLAGPTSAPADVTIP